MPHVNVPVVGRAGSPVVDNNRVATLGNLNDCGVVCAFRAVILSQFRTESTRLDAHHGIQLRIEVRLPTKDLCSNLILFDWDPWVFYRVFGEIAQKFAEGFGAMEGMAGHQTLDFRKELRSVRQCDSGDTNVTRMYQLPHVLAIPRFIPCNRIKLSDTYLT